MDFVSFAAIGRPVRAEPVVGRPWAI